MIWHKIPTVKDDNKRKLPRCLHAGPNPTSLVFWSPVFTASRLSD